jgi:hypothetical protein
LDNHLFFYSKLLISFQSCRLAQRPAANITPTIAGKAQAISIDSKDKLQEMHDLRGFLRLQ